MSAIRYTVELFVMMRQIQQALEFGFAVVVVVVEVVVVVVNEKARQEC